MAALAATSAGPARVLLRAFGHGEGGGLQGDTGQAEAEMQAATKQLDRAGHKNIIHKNAAARTKSRLQKLIKGAKS